jgi:hypothetical protein
MGDRGEPDARGPWNAGNGWELVHAPAFRELASPTAGTRVPNNGNPEMESDRPMGEGRSTSQRKQSQSATAVAAKKKKTK